MEDQVGLAAVKPASASWIVGPWFDLLLLANVAWPLLLLPSVSTDQDTAVDFWQVYFLTLPHRWITLFLVAIDSDRRQSRTGWMIGLSLLFALAIIISYWGFDLGTRAFLCLGFVDYLWNGWHFGSQHSGVLRMYSRKAGVGWPGLERWGVRSFVFLTILRTSSALLWPQWFSAYADWFAYCDWLLLLIPAVVLSLSLLTFKPGHLARFIYLASISLLYGTYLLASHYHAERLVLCMATAAALFHAVEYLGIVTHYATRRQQIGSPGLMRWLAQRWLATLACFVLTLGILGVYLSSFDGQVGTFWQGLNLWAALLHYSLDGMIWKLRQPTTAQSLGVA